MRVVPAYRPVFGPRWKRICLSLVRNPDCHHSISRACELSVEVVRQTVVTGKNQQTVESGRVFFPAFFRRHSIPTCWCVSVAGTFVCERVLWMWKALWRCCCNKQKFSKEHRTYRRKRKSCGRSGVGQWARRSEEERVTIKSSTSGLLRSYRGNCYYQCGLQLFLCVAGFINTDFNRCPKQTR